MVKEKVTKLSKGCKPYLMYSVIAAIVICALLLNFVDVGQGVQLTGNAIGDGQGALQQMFASWTTGDFDVNIAKYMFFAMVAVLLYSSFSAVRFPDDDYLKWIISIPGAFLLVAYITPAEVFSILTLYSTVGIVMTSIIPLMVLLFFSSMLLTVKDSKKKQRVVLTPGKILLQLVLWIFFFAVLLMKLITGIVNGQVSVGLNIVFIVMAVATVAVFLVLFLNKKFRNWIGTVGLEIRAAEHKYEIQSAIQERDLASTLANPSRSGVGSPYGH